VSADACRSTLVILNRAGLVLYVQPVVSDLGVPEVPAVFLHLCCQVLHGLVVEVGVDLLFKGGFDYWVAVCRGFVVAVVVKCVVFG